jgi:hypothetical protein
MLFRLPSFLFSFWLFAVSLLFTSVAPVAHATTTATLPIALQGNYTISSVSLDGSSLSLPSSAKTYSLKLGSKGLTAVNATTLGTLFKKFSFGTLIKATVTSTTPTTLKGKLSGKIAYSGLSVTVGSGSGITAKVVSPGVLTLAGTINGSASAFGFPIFSGTIDVAITLKKKTSTPAKS